MSRKIAREVLMKLLYERDLAGEYHDESLGFLYNDFKLNANDKQYVEDILFSFDSQKVKIDSYIEKLAKDWTLDRMAKVDLAILRLSLYELENRDDIPANVSINEAVELAKKYGNEKSTSFINGILGQYVRIYKPKE